MAILADLQGEDAEKIIIKILKKIRKFSPARAAICTVQMRVFSNLRNLQDTVTKILQKMPYAIDLSKDPFFSSEFARATMQGEAVGEARGETRGITIGESKIIKNFLETGRFSVEEIAEYAKVPLAFVLEVQKQLNPPKTKGRTKKI